MHDFFKDGDKRVRCAIVQLTTPRRFPGTTKFIFQHENSFNNSVYFQREEFLI